ncbi:hypothetical protein D9756_009690 [Leucocoprinus leucothites]|uniref:Uncharacterized protein n=1 Tax=Leucocoprinus leucothites TaxID=201217 RepID=A0A8H5FTH5_9AGAR|nr:hypothetical protein D9756_009690 [Leucoagaricus leucothites]
MPAPRPVLRLDSIDEHPEYTLNLGAESPAFNLSIDDRIPTPPPRVFHRSRSNSIGKVPRKPREAVDRDCGICSIAAAASTVPAKETVIRNDKFHTILKPEHAAFQLENQKFALGNRMFYRIPLSYSDDVRWKILGALPYIFTDLTYTPLQFFRFICERYPLIAKEVEGNRIPEFDNFYLDFNEIIHQSAQLSNGTDFQSEEEIFSSVFRYVDYLFGMIRPRQVFFIAVDGVSPRAKMRVLWQRAFLDAKLDQELKEEAERNGEIPSQGQNFDVYCVQPGTPFMTRISEHLHYYVSQKITEDETWHNIEVVLSGPDVPGEGKHKIMEYIRASRTQQGYNQNTRHCVYGSDADLVVRGLSSHEPFFSVLREKSRFSFLRQNGARSFDEMRFTILHLSLLREYLDLEFCNLAPMLPFEYSLENIIDDFILLTLFLGNDFLPYLPPFHMPHNRFESLLEIYKDALPALDGYLNMGGTISLKRLQILQNKMALFERQYMEKRLTEKFTRVWTEQEREIFRQVKAYVLSTRLRSPAEPSSLSMMNNFSARECAFIRHIAGVSGLKVHWDKCDADGNDIIIWTSDDALDEDLVKDTHVGNRSSMGDSDDSVDNSGGTGKSTVTAPVLNRYDELLKLDRTTDQEPGPTDDSVGKEILRWKSNYYEKLGILDSKSDDMKQLVYRYVEGLEWIVRYYYKGIPSWSWVFNYHFSPRVSDLQDIDQLTFNFDVGQPFKPLEQLVAMMSPVQMENVPPTCRGLLTAPDSPILDLYPTEFEVDKRTKVIAKIPFIDEERLIRAMEAIEHKLTPEERYRNRASAALKMTYGTHNSTTLPSPCPDILPHIYDCRTHIEPLTFSASSDVQPLPSLGSTVSADTQSSPGFPSFKTIPHSAVLDFRSVNAHRPPETETSGSRNKSIIVKVNNPHEGLSAQEIAERTIGERIFIEWPSLREGLVTGVSDSTFVYDWPASRGDRPSKVVSIRHSIRSSSQWKNKVERLEQIYLDRGVSTGPVEVLLLVRPLLGMQTSETGATTKEYVVESDTVDFPVQMCVTTVDLEDPRFVEKGPSQLRDLFPEDAQVTYLGDNAYGSSASVAATRDTSLTVLAELSSEYLPSYQVADLLHISPLALGKITSSFFVRVGLDDFRVNIGLDLKFNGKGIRVVGYTKKEGKHWQYSDKAIALVKSYQAEFPEIFECLDTVGFDAPPATNVFKNSEPRKRMREVVQWLEARGVPETFERVPLSYEVLPKETIAKLEHMLDSMTQTATDTTTKEIIIEKYPSPAILPHGYSLDRMRKQVFALGDRVRMVRSSGLVSPGEKGVVVGYDNDFIDVVWDKPFILGSTLSGRCSKYRGATVDPKTCLNLTNPQFIFSMGVKNPSSPVNVPSNRYIPPHLRTSQLQASNTRSRSLSELNIDEHPEYTLNLGAESPASNLSIDDRIPTPPPRVFRRSRSNSTGKVPRKPREVVDRDCGICGCTDLLQMTAAHYAVPHAPQIISPPLPRILHTATATHDSSLLVLVELLVHAIRQVGERAIEDCCQTQASSNYPFTKEPISPLALLKDTSNLPVITHPNEHKFNIGLDLKFDRRYMKVIVYTEKEERRWEYSDKAVELLRAYKANFPEIFGPLEYIGDGIPLVSDVFKDFDPEKRLIEAQTWLEDAVLELEQRLDSITPTTSESMKPAGEIIIGDDKVSAILKNKHAASRLENQKFALGDHVRMVRNSGPVPLAAKGVVVGHDENSIDVSWDEPFMLGTDP